MLTSGGRAAAAHQRRGRQAIQEFSADGREIYYGRLLGRAEIWAVPTLGGNPRRVVQATVIAPSLDGKWLFFVAEGSRTITRSDPSGLSGQEVFKLGDAGFIPSKLLPFPGGNELLLATDNQDGMVLKDVRLSDRTATVAGSFSDESTLPVWDQPGKSLLLGRSVNGIENIWRFNLTDHSLTQITFGSGPDSSPMPDPSGRGIYYINGKSAGFLTAYNTRTKQSLDIAEARATQPTISPDGKRVEYATVSGQQGQELWVAGIDGKNKVKIASAEVIGTGAWSRDSSRFLYGDYSVSPIKIYLAEADGSSIRPVPYNGNYAGTIIFNEDEKFVYVSTFKSDSSPVETWKISPEGADPQLVSAGCAFVSDTSADGKYLIAFKSSGSESGIYEISTADHKCTKLLPDVATFGVIFAPDQKSFLYAVGTRSSVTIYRQAWRDGKVTGQPQTAFKVPFGFSIYSSGNAYDFSRDLSTIVYARPGGQQDLYLLSQK